MKAPNHAEKGFRIGDLIFFYDCQAETLPVGVEVFLSLFLEGGRLKFDPTSKDRTERTELAYRTARRHAKIGHKPTMHPGTGPLKAVVSS